MADPHVVKEVLRAGRRRRATPKEVKAALETGIVESGFRNLKGGDADSAGWRQERASIYPDPTSVAHSAERFFAEAKRANVPGISAGELAARVQRPAARYRGRYDDAAAQAEQILHSLSGVRYTPTEAPDGSRVVNTLRETSRLDEKGYADAKRMALLGRLLARRHGTDSPLFRSGVLSTTDPDPADFTRTSLTGSVRAAKSSKASAPATGSGHAAVDFARQRVGHYSENLGANRGSELDQLQARFKMRGEPWCAIFATTAASHGGASRAVRTASVAQIRQWAAEGSHGYAGLLPGSEAQAGDLLTFGDRHVGVVERVENGTIHTIEGNTSTGGVRRVTRKASEGMVARPKYAQR